MRTSDKIQVFDQAKVFPTARAELANPGAFRVRSLFVSPGHNFFGHHGGHREIILRWRFRRLNVSRDGAFGAIGSLTLKATTKGRSRFFRKKSTKRCAKTSSWKA
jgi:hypothetical protein